MMNLKDKYNSIAFLITIFILIFSLIIISSPTSYLDSIGNNYKSSNEDFDSNNFSQIKKADYWNLTGTPILIDGVASGVGAPNWTWAVSRPWCRGSGNSTDPYIIENITIDSQGSEYGIKIQNSLNYYFIIRNCTLINAGSSSSDAGIKLFNVRNGTIIYNNCSFNNYNGIYAFSCSNNNISANILSNNLIYGIFLDACRNFTLSLNNFTGCGINLGYAPPTYYLYHKIDVDNYINGKKVYYYVNQSNLNSNNFTDAGQIILINCNNSIIDNQNFTLGSVGILLHSCNNNTISNLTISNHTLYGIRLRISDYNNLTNITLMNLESGIYLEANSTNNIIKNNTISNCIYGIYLKDKSNLNNLTDNKLYNNDEGFHLGSNINTTIINNTLEIGNYGIYLFNSNYSSILGNNFTDFDERGIYSEFSYENKIIGNVLYNSSIVLHSCVSYTLSYNRFKNSGLEFEFINGDSSYYNTHSINITNLVNERPLYYYADKNNLRKDNFTDASQIILFNCNNSIISNQNTSHTINGITSYRCFNNTISNNALSTNRDHGIYIRECYNYTLTNNIIYNNYINGIFLWGSHWSNISKNEVYENDYGIYLKLSNYSVIEKNLINYNNIGIYLESSNSTYVIDNTLIGNSVCIDDNDNCQGNIFINNRCVTVQGDDDAEKKENIHADNFLLIVGIGFGIGALIVVSGLSIFHLSKKKAFSLKGPFQKSKKIKSSQEILAEFDIIELSELFSKEGVPEALVFLRDIDLTLISKEFMKKADKLRFDEKDKVEFLKEILYFSLKEREDIVSNLLKMSKHAKRIK